MKVPYELTYVLVMYLLSTVSIKSNHKEENKQTAVFSSIFRTKNITIFN